MADKVPNPGSDEAINQGCICPVLDNHYGAGARGAYGDMFWVNGDCPLHGVAVQEHKLYSKDDSDEHKA